MTLEEDWNQQGESEGEASPQGCVARPWWLGDHAWDPVLRFGPEEQAAGLEAPIGGPGTHTHGLAAMQREASDSAGFGEVCKESFWEEGC